nr:hypothetical protein [Tanacetum cinerariifolium]
MDDLIRQYVMKQETLNLNHETRFQNQEATLQLMQNQMGQMVKILQERPLGVLPSNTVPNPREQINLITTKSGLATAEHSIPPHVPPTLREELEKEPETLMDEVHIASPASTAHVSPPGIQPVSPPKPKGSINHMPLLIYEKLRIRPLKPTQMTLELANRCVTYPMGIAEDVIVNTLLAYCKGSCRSLRREADTKDRDEELVFCAEIFSKHSPSRERHSVYSINIIDSLCEEISNQNKQSSGSTTSHSDLSLPDYESFCFDVDHQEEKSSSSTTSRSDHSLPDYEAFCFDIDHHKEKSSGSTTSYSDPSLLEYESFYFDLSIDPLPSAERSDSHHEEFADELAHIISPSEYDHFYFDIKVDPGELTRLLIENSSSNNVNLTEVKEDNELKPKTSTKKLTIHELNDLRLLLSNCDSTFSKEFSEIDFLVLFPFENKDKIFDLEIFIIK